VPDSLVGTDSHTTMINGLGVVGWGVGGIEAEAVMLGQPLYMLLPEVVGFELTGELPGATATDLVLTVTQICVRKKSSASSSSSSAPASATMKLADRATIANMAPEYGATMGFFPIDDETLLPAPHRPHRSRSGRWSSVTRRSKVSSAPIRRNRAEIHQDGSLDLSAVEPSLAGPKRPQDRVPLAAMKRPSASAPRPVAERGFQLDEAALEAHRRKCKPTTAQSARRSARRGGDRRDHELHEHQQSEVMLGAGLLAKKAVAKGLEGASRYVKTSLAPGSRVVTDYLEKAGVATSGARSRSGFTPSAMAARRASATAVRCPMRSPRPSPKATSSRRPCSAAIATSKAASIRW
jgi:aconitate hydratase